MIDTKKQAENAFGKGLVMDSHPINSDNNTLSNCLNGTLITYNGNELMLQNDMGNGRVETAFLPPGYVPLGTKEHGGIIYVASYNPITNHGLLGSFPSPERNISSDEMGNPNLLINTGTFDFSSKDGVDTLYSKLSILDDNTIRPGDKFALYFKSAATDLSNYITNYDNSDNKILKLSIAVRDNNGNLQDITEDLKILSNNYFMENMSNDKADLSTLDGLRQISDDKNFNIYKGKLSGELYLVAELATITDFELSVSGDSKEKTLTFEGDFKSEVENIFKGLKIILKDLESNSTLEGYKDTQDFKVANVSLDAKILYSITPCLKYAVLNGMTKSGVIDMSLFGSGEIRLNEWRYYNDLTSNNLNISWGLNTYLRNDAHSSEAITSVTFNFYKYQDDNFYLNNSIVTKSRKNYNGNFIETISYDEIEHGLLYVVLIEVKVVYNGTERTEYFYKLLYTSEYFNRYYSDTSVLDFQSQEVELQIQSDVLLEEKSNQINKGAITASPTYSSKVPTTDYQGYPFYYIENRHNVKDYDLTVNNYLSYDSFDSKNEVWDFPFVLDESNISTEVDIKNEKAKISDLVVYGNFINDIQQGQEFEKSEELKNDTVSFTSSYSGNTLSVNINTFAKYLAETTVADVKATSGTGFRSYMHEDNLEQIFGYKPSGILPQYGLNMKVGRESLKHRLQAGICEYSGDNYSASYKGVVLENLKPYRTWRKWSEICPLVVNGLQKSLKTTPSIFFIIGGDTDKWSAGTQGNSTLVTSKESTIDYNIVLWKGSSSSNHDLLYYFLNQYFTKLGSTNGLASLIDIFKHIYTKLDFVSSGTIYKSSNSYSYIQDYKVNYKGDVEISLKIDGDIKAKDFNAKSALGKFKETLGDKISDELYDVLLTSKNLDIKITSYATSTHEINMEAEAPSIDATVMQYVEASGSAVDRALNGVNGEVIEFDYAGNPFNDNEMYYIGGDGLAYPVSNPSGLTNSALSSINVSAANLNMINKGFKVEYDNSVKAYQIRINPSGVFSYTSDLSGGIPKISTDNLPFRIASGGNGCLLNITLTSNGKKLI